MTCPECGHATASRQELEHGRLLRGYATVGIGLGVLMLGLTLLIALDGLRQWRRLAALEKVGRLNGKVVAFSAKLDPKDGWIPEPDVTAFQVRLMAGVASVLIEEAGMTGTNGMAQRIARAMGPNETRIDEKRVWLTGTRRLIHSVLFPVDHYSNLLNVTNVRSVKVRPLAESSLEGVPEEVRRFWAEFSEIRGVDVSGFVIDDKDIRALDPLTHLEDISLSGIVAHPDVMASVLGSKAISWSAFNFERAMSAEDLRWLSRSTARLYGLSLSSKVALDPSLDEELAKVIDRQRPSYLALKLKMNPRYFQRTMQSIGDAHVMWTLRLELADCGDLYVSSHLDRLSITSLSLGFVGTCEMTDEGLAWISQKGMLESVKISGAPRVTGAFLASMGMNLKRLSLADMPIEDQVLLNCYVSELEELSLKGTKVTSEGLMAVTFTRLQRLTYTGVKASDALCEKLAKNAKFEMVSLEGVSAQGISSLAKMAKPTTVYVENPRFSESEEAQARAAGLGERLKVVRREAGK